jgi:hypothetical protein
MKLAPGTVGAIGELTVASDLLDRGMHVFRALSPSCPFDLIATSVQGTASVEVRCAVKAPKGKYYISTIIRNPDTAYDC